MRNTWTFARWAFSGSSGRDTVTLSVAPIATVLSKSLITSAPRPQSMVL